MAKQRKKRTPWEGEHWRDSSWAVVSIEPDGEVLWRDGWTAAQKREYLEDYRQSALDLYPDTDTNGGTFAILEQDVQKAEAEEAHAQAPNLTFSPLTEQGSVLESR